jgi:DNA-binding beta-propeller fold protein YncE
MSQPSLVVHFGLVVCCGVATNARAQDAAPAAPAASTSGFRLLETFKVGGDGGWDYLTADGNAKRVYVSRSTHVMVVGSEDGKVVGDIPDTQGVHGIALAPEFGRGFTSNGRSDSVTIFDLATLKPIGSAKTGKGPDAILFDATTKRVFAFDGHGGDATVIDAKSGDVVGAITLGGKPESGVADGKGRVYVNLEDKSEIVEIDAKELRVLNHWAIAPGEEPSGLAIDPKNRVLFSGCGNAKMAIVDADRGTVITTVPIGKGIDACAFDPSTGCAFASNGDGTLTVVHEDARDKYSVVENVKTRRGSKTMALDPVTHRVYLGAADFEAPVAAPSGGGRPPRPAAVAGSFSVLVFAR